MNNIQLAKVILLLFSLVTLAQAQQSQIQLGEKPQVFSTKFSQGINFEASISQQQEISSNTYFILVIQSLSQGVDQQVYGKLLETSSSVPASKKENILVCTGSSTNVCLITGKQLLANSKASKVSLNIQCQSDCSFEISANIQSTSLPLSPILMDTEKFFFKSEAENLSFLVQIDNSSTRPITNFQFEVELVNPEEVKHFFSMKVYSQSNDLLFEKDQLGNAQSKGIFQLKGSKLSSGTSQQVRVEIETRAKSILRVQSQGYDKIRNVSVARQYEGEVLSNSEKTFQLDAIQILKQAKAMNFQLVATTGICQLSVDTRELQPQLSKLYQHQSKNTSGVSQAIRIDSNLFGTKGIFWISVKSTSKRCQFILRTDFSQDSQILGMNFPVSGTTVSNKLDLFTLVLSGSHPESIKLILNSEDPSADIILKKCPKGASCTVSSSEANNKLGSGIQRTVDLQAHNKILKFDFSPEICTPSSEVDEPIFCASQSQVYAIGVFAKGEGSDYTLHCVSSKGATNLRERETFFDEMTQLEYMQYSLHLFDEEASSLKFTIVNQYGQLEADLFFSTDKSIDDEDMQTLTPVAKSQWGVIEIYEPNSGYYFLRVFAKSHSKYAITAYVDRQSETHSEEIIELPQDMPFQTSLKDGTISSLFSVKVVKIDNLVPNIWITLDSLSNSYEIWVTQDESVLQSNDRSKYQWQFLLPSRKEMNLESASITSSRIFIKVVPLQVNSSQLFVIKLRSEFIYSAMKLSTAVSVHIPKNSTSLFKIPIKGNEGIVISKTALTCRGRTIKLQIDFSSELRTATGFYEEYTNNIVSIPEEVITAGCDKQISAPCLLFLKLVSDNLLVENQNTNGIIHAYDGYSNLIRVPEQGNKPVQVDFFITKPEDIIVTVAHSIGLQICANIVNDNGADSSRANLQQCLVKSQTSKFVDSTQVKVTSLQVQEICEFFNPQAVCMLQIDISTYLEVADTKSTFRLTITSGIIELQKGKQYIGHTEVQNLQLFKYTSNSEYPISIHLLPLDSSDLDLFVIFGDDQELIPYQQYDWSLHEDDFDEHNLKIGSPTPAQKGSLLGVYTIGVFSKSSFTRFQIQVTQEFYQILELQNNSHQSLKMHKFESVFFEYVPQLGDTLLRIKLFSEYGAPKVAIKKVSSPLKNNLPNIENGDFTISNRDQADQDTVEMKIENTDGKEVYFIQVWSGKEKSKLTLSLTTSQRMHILYNKSYNFKFQDLSGNQQLSYEAKEHGQIFISLDYGTAHVQYESSTITKNISVDYGTSFNYSPQQQIKMSILCSNCSFTVIAVGFLESQQYRLGEIRTIAIKRDESFEMRFAFDPTQGNHKLQLNAIVENEFMKGENLLGSFQLNTQIIFSEKKYDLQQLLNPKQRKFDHSWVYEFDALKGNYKVKISWPSQQKINPQAEAIKLKIFMTSEKDIFLHPNIRFSSRLYKYDKMNFIQRKSSHQTLSEDEQNIIIALTICSGMPAQILAGPFLNEFNLTSNADTRKFDKMSNNLLVYEQSGPEKEILMQLTGSDQDTVFTFESQIVPKGIISIYKLLYIMNPNIGVFYNKQKGLGVFTIQFEGVRSLSQYEKEITSEPEIQYEVYLFKREAVVLNSACPDLSIATKNATDISRNGDIESDGYHLASIFSTSFNRVESLDLDIHQISMSKFDYYFIIEAHVLFQGQSAYYIYHSVQVPFAILEEKEVPFYQNVITISAIVAAVGAIVALIMVIRKKMKYFQLPEVLDLQNEQIKQNESDQSAVGKSAIIGNISISN